MPRQFQCLNCGYISRPVSNPPKCAKCGSGNGVIEPARNGNGNGTTSESKSKKSQ